MLVAPQFVKGDIQSADLMSFVMQEENIDTVMHFAAQARWPRRDSAQTNLRPAVHTLTASDNQQDSGFSLVVGLNVRLT